MDHTGGDSDARVFKRKEDATWETISIPFPSAHAFDICKWNNKLWVDMAQVSAAPNNRMAVACSNDGGVTWARINCYDFNGTSAPATTIPDTNRLISGFFPFSDSLYACHRIVDPEDDDGEYADQNGVFQYDATTNKFIRKTKFFLMAGEM